LAPFLAAARGYICFQKSGFPIQAIEALSTGTPIWMDADSQSLEYLEPGKEGLFTGRDFSTEAIEIFSRMQGLDVKKIHGQVQKFHDLKFRSWVDRQVSKIKESISENKENSTAL